MSKMNRIASNIYSYKAEMMGVAIILIIIFHTIIPKLPSELYEIKRFGEVGVDIFLFLGGFTCANSYLSSTSLLSFYKKRLVRILPAYLLVWGFIHTVFAIRYDEGILELLSNLLFWKVLFHNDLRNWYVPAILLMYFITPSYVKFYKYGGMLLPYIIIIIIIVFLIQSVGLGYYDIPFAMFWLRLPVYLIGINVFLKKDKIILNNGIVIVCAFLSAICAYLMIHYNLTEAPFQFRRFLYIPLAFAFVYFYDYKSKYLFFIGGITLELYLIHEFLQGLIWDKLSPPVFVLFLVSLPLSLLFSYSLHIFLKKVL